MDTENGRITERMATVTTHDPDMQLDIGKIESIDDLKKIVPA